MGIRMVLGILVLMASAASAMAQPPSEGGTQAPICLDPLQWSCSTEYGDQFDNPGGCRNNGACPDIGGGRKVCSKLNPRERGSGYPGTYTSGTIPAGKGTEVTAGAFKTCVIFSSCEEDCMDDPMLPEPVCVDSFIPPLPLGGFDYTFGNPCP